MGAKLDFITVWVRYVIGDTWKCLVREARRRFTTK